MIRISTCDDDRNHAFNESFIYLFPPYVRTVEPRTVPFFVRILVLKTTFIRMVCLFLCEKCITSYRALIQ